MWPYSCQRSHVRFSRAQLHGSGAQPKMGGCSSASAEPWWWLWRDKGSTATFVFEISAEAGGAAPHQILAILHIDTTVYTHSPLDSMDHTNKRAMCSAARETVLCSTRQGGHTIRTCVTASCELLHKLNIADCLRH